MSYKISILETKVDVLISETTILMKQNLDRILKSGSIDIDDYDPESMVLPKIIVTALLEEMAEMYVVRGSQANIAKKEVKNIRLFL